MPLDSAIDFAGTKRFEIKRRLGEGGMGVVYEAFDREREMTVALKTLRHADGQALDRFKKEFRALQDIQHPNLISLDELIVTEGIWFFTMELIEGTDFSSYVRPNSALMAFGETQDPLQENACSSGPQSGKRPLADSYDEARLRAALKQLAQGIAYLHTAGKVHRDIKPSNILVTPEGRVVLVDFGLVTHVRPDRQSSQAAMVGTAEYMAPEQALSENIGPATDWYSMGVVLYEALTGSLPHAGKTVYDILHKKQEMLPLPPRQLLPLVPEDLDELCMELLHIDPNSRPPVHEILDWLGADSEPLAQDSQSAPLSSFTQVMPFVGRQNELRQLGQAYADSCRGKAVNVFIHGQSGLGKSELVKKFARSLVVQDRRVLVLSGRCYERESVPYKAFDGIADSLCRYMKGLSETEVARLLPLRASFLPQLFPVLQQIKAIANAPLPAPIELDPHERRTRMFHAFRELLARLANGRPVVLVIDDFQWAGADSLAMLAEIMSSGEAPTLLLLGTARPGVEDLLDQKSSGDTRHLHLGELPPAQAMELVELLAPQLNKQVARALAEEADGHPLFILELVRHLDQKGTAGSMRLDEALWARICRLESIPRQLIEILAVAGAPLAQKTAALVTGLSYHEYEKVVRALRIGFLVRTRGQVTDTIETYHDRVREAVLAKLDEAKRISHHHDLATALENSGAAATDPQALVRHFAAAGEAQRAVSHAEEAALRASATSAFDQAARFFKTALDLGEYSEGKTRQLRLQLGKVLVGAGRGAEAAEVFLAVADGADPTTRLECRRQAAEQLLISGHLEDGLQAVDSLLAEVGMKMPATPMRALLSLIYQRAKLRLRGLVWKEKQENQIAVENLTRLDVYKTVAHGLGIVDSIRGMDFQARGLLLALQTGERSRLARALFLEANFIGSRGDKHSLAQARDLLGEGTRIAAAKNSPYLKAWVLGVDGCLCYFGSQFRQAAEKTAAAESSFCELGGAAWEMSTTRLFRMWSLLRMGAFAEMAPIFDAYLRDAEHRGDLYAQTTLIRTCQRLLLALGSAEDPKRDLARVKWIPPEGRYHLQHWFEFEARAEHALYQGQTSGILKDARINGRGLKKSMLLRLQIVRTIYAWLRARLLLADSVTRPGQTADLREVGRIARALEKERNGYAQVMALLVRATIAMQKGDDQQSRTLLDEAIKEAQQQDMHLHQAAAERRLGSLIGGEEGAAFFEKGTSWMGQQGVVDAERMTEVILPGFRKQRS